MPSKYHPPPPEKGEVNVATLLQLPLFKEEMNMVISLQHHSHKRPIMQGIMLQTFSLVGMGSVVIVILSDGVDAYLSHCARFVMSTALDTSTLHAFATSMCSNVFGHIMLQANR